MFKESRESIRYSFESTLSERWRIKQLALFYLEFEGVE
jgi:hypothetical protein